MHLELFDVEDNKVLEIIKLRGEKNVSEVI
jgi:hypothetical protein